MAHFATENIRTVALVGDGASGKTTLAEALLGKAGAIAAPGSVERGTTVSDFDPIEKISASDATLFELGFLALRLAKLLYNIGTKILIESYNLQLRFANF